MLRLRRPLTPKQINARLDKNELADFDGRQDERGARDAYEVHELLATLDGGHAAYVRFALDRGHYVPLCLVQFGKSNKTHADAGMVGEFDVV